jgi:hypothetical protein
MPPPLADLRFLADLGPWYIIPYHGSQVTILLIGVAAQLQSEKAMVKRECALLQVLVLVSCCSLKTGVAESDSDRKIEEYFEVICLRCAQRSIDCGCELGELNPPFRLISSYAAEYNKARVLISEFEPINYRWLVLDITGGIGNQLICFVNGLLLALSTKRLLLLRPLGLTASSDYNSLQLFDSVIPWMSTNFVTSHDIPLPLDVPNVTAVINHWSKHTVEAIMCSDSLDAWNTSPEILHLRYALQDVHLLHANPRYQFRETFRGLELFFLSHLLWTGARELDEPVQVATLPLPAAWDGETSLRSLISGIRSSSPSAVIGVHARVSANVFELMDTFNFPAGWRQSCEGQVPLGADQGSAWKEDDFCFSSSLDCLLACVPVALADAAGNGTGRPAPSPAHPLVILWATDDDDYSRPLRDELAALPGARLVRLLFDSGAPHRHDQLPRSGLLDLRLLSEAEALVGTTLSTFSYVAHARGLAAPYYPAFRDPCGPRGACGRGAGPEAGLLARGPAHVGCALRGEDGVEVLRCARTEDDCVTSLLDPGWTAGTTIGCLPSCRPAATNAAATTTGDPGLGPAAGGAAGRFAERYLVDVDTAAQFEHVWSKRGRRLELERPALGLPACPGLEVRVSETRRRRGGGEAARSTRTLPARDERPGRTLPDELTLPDDSDAGAHG